MYPNQKKLDFFCTQEGIPWASCKNAEICKFIPSPEQYAEQLEKCKEKAAERDKG